MRMCDVCVLLAAVLGCGSACVTTEISRTTNSVEMDRISIPKHGVEGYYKPGVIVTAEATVTVTVTDNGKNKVIDGENFRVQLREDNQNDRTASRFYEGSTMPVVTVGTVGVPELQGLPTVGGASPLFKDDKSYAIEAVNYRLIKRARSVGAAVFLDEPGYEWSVKEESKYKKFLYFFDILESKKVTYKVQATAQTASIVYFSERPAEATAGTAAPRKALPPDLTAEHLTSEPATTAAPSADAAESTGPEASTADGEAAADPNPPAASATPAPATPASAAPAATPAPATPAPATPASAAPAATPAPPAGAAAPAAAARIETGRRTLLTLTVATVRALKQLVDTEVSVVLTTGETRRGRLVRVDRPGLVTSTGTIPWNTIVAVEPAQ
jgi:hypothetical protein